MNEKDDLFRYINLRWIVFVLVVSEIISHFI